MVTTSVLSDLRPNVHGYIDVVRAWFRTSLSDSELTRLREHSGGLHVHDWPARFNDAFVQRATVYQPSRAALERLGRRNDILLNYAEIALDLTFGSEEDKQTAHVFVCRHLVKQYHRDQDMRFVGADGNVTCYTGPRHAANVIVAYADKPSRVTGASHCAHIEWRMQGAASLRRAGIHGPRDLARLDHAAFWRKRLRLYDIDRRALGRRYHNHINGTRRRHPWIFRHRCGFSLDLDQRVGAIIVRACGTSQGVVDRCRRHFSLHGCFDRIDVQGLLSAL